MRAANVRARGFGDFGKRLGKLLIPPASPRGAILASLAILFFWIPLFGFWLASRAYGSNAQTHGLSKSVSISALIMSVIFTGGLVMAVVLVPLMLLVFRVLG